jgi:poly(hydroxyalkanoate) depolymerase family esterase
MKHTLRKGFPKLGRLSDLPELGQRLFQAGKRSGDGERHSGRPDGLPSFQVPEALSGLLDRVKRGDFTLPLGDLAAPAPVKAPRTPSGAKFLSESFSGAQGSRPYKLYVPSGYRDGQPAPLVVMLHGCLQSPDDFAAGTRMNEAAERQGCLVAYPAQTSAANSSRCWNWFNPADQRRDGGEPAIIAGIVRQIMASYAVDPRRVYVAGLSAGGAEAAILAEVYPDLFAAVGVHSGLACGAASDMSSAFVAMRAGTGQRRGRSAGAARPIPAIVFHGDRDTTVHPSNGDAVIAHARPDGALRTRVEQGRVAGGHGYTKTLTTEADGRTLLEQWVIHGAGHAWAGGSPSGSYTDPQGPDATAEMLRFFMEHPRP